jgi:hypothetical protein
MVSCLEYMIKRNDISILSYEIMCIVYDIMTNDIILYLNDAIVFHMISSYAL